MSTREDSHHLIDQLPENKLEHARLMLSALLKPPPTPPEVVAMRERSNEYRKRVQERFRETRKPGTVSGMGGSGGIGFNNEHGSFGSTSFHYWDEKALVYQTLRYFSGQEFEQMERMSTSEDKTQVLYVQEITSGGRTVRREEAFPFVGTREV